ncbi:MAG: hypothetical protein IJV27_04655 [Prevotella sp.]|nr:hypothetical protein [Prevotella sp.]
MNGILSEIFRLKGVVFHLNGRCLPFKWLMQEADGGTFTWDGWPLSSFEWPLHEATLSLSGG